MTLIFYIYKNINVNPYLKYLQVVPLLKTDTKQEMLPPDALVEPEASIFASVSRSLSKYRATAAEAKTSIGLFASPAGQRHATSCTAAGESSGNQHSRTDDIIHADAITSESSAENNGSNNDLALRLTIVENRLAEQDEHIDQLINLANDMFTRQEDLVQAVDRLSKDACQHSSEKGAAEEAYEIQNAFVDMDARIAELEENRKRHDAAADALSNSLAEIHRKQRLAVTNDKDIWKSVHEVQHQIETYQRDIRMISTKAGALHSETTQAGAHALRLTGQPDQDDVPTSHLQPDFDAGEQYSQPCSIESSNKQLFQSSRALEVPQTPSMPVTGHAYSKILGNSNSIDFHQTQSAMHQRDNNMGRTESYRQDQAARRIQLAYRNHIARLVNESDECLMAIRVQGAERGLLARAAVGGLDKLESNSQQLLGSKPMATCEEAIFLQEDIEYGAATVLQAAWRGFALRKRLYAATHVQKAWRGHAVRRQYAQLYEANRFIAAEDIQRVFRGFLVRRPRQNLQHQRKSHLPEPRSNSESRLRRQSETTHPEKSQLQNQFETQPQLEQDSLNTEDANDTDSSDDSELEYLVPAGRPQPPLDVLNRTSSDGIDWPREWRKIARHRQGRQGSLTFGEDTFMEITPRSAADADRFFPDPHCVAAAESDMEQAWPLEVQIAAIIIQTEYRAFAARRVFSTLRLPGRISSRLPLSNDRSHSHQSDLSEETSTPSDFDPQLLRYGYNSNSRWLLLFTESGRRGDPYFYSLDTTETR
eukprot:SAG31_NODE_141_length_22675_cov_48.948879_3_plen_763_part_00